MDKNNLIIIRNKHNDKGSDLYLKSIRKQWKDNYQDDINLIVYRTDDQDELEKQMSIQKGQILLLEPTNLYLPEYMLDRNAENHQTAHFVCDTIKQLRSTLDAKILIVGKGIIGKKIFDELCIKSGYCCTMYGSKFDIDASFSSQFDIVINAVSQNAKTVEYVNCKYLFDISGNFEPLDKEVSFGNCPRSGHTEYGFVKSNIDNFYGIGEIGLNTVFRLLEEVKNS